MSFVVLSNAGLGGPIDYATTVAAVASPGFVTGSLTPGSWSFGVRAYDGFGDGGFGDIPWGSLGSRFGEAGFGSAGFGSGEEQNLDCALTVVIDEHGNDVTSIPMPPVGLRAFAQAGGSVRVEWVYPPSPLPAPWPTWPTGFHVYLGTGGAPDYAVVIGSVPFSDVVAGCAFVADLTGLSDGVTYAVAVRAFNGSGEERNTVSVSVAADATGPLGVDVLLGVAIV